MFESLLKVELNNPSSKFVMIKAQILIYHAILRAVIIFQKAASFRLQGMIREGIIHTILSPLTASTAIAAGLELGI